MVVIAPKTSTKSTPSHNTVVHKPTSTPVKTSPNVTKTSYTQEKTVPKGTNNHVSTQAPVSSPTQATKAPTSSPNKVSENNLASKLNELKESNKSQTSSTPVSQPSSSGSEITRTVHEKITAPVAKVESQNSEGTGGTLPSQTIKPSDILKGLEKLGKNKGTGNVDYNVITLQDEVHGTINGKEKTLYPNKNWYAYEYLSKNGTNGMTEDGKYKIAVAPRVIDPNYPDSGHIYADDFDGLNMSVDIILENMTTGETKILKCSVTDIKAHSYNTYNGNGNNVTFDIGNGLVQTGIAYPNSWNFKNETPFSEYNSDGSVVEFIIKPTDFSPTNYKLKEIRTYN